MNLIIFAIISAILALIFAVYFAVRLKRQDAGTAEMIEISKAIQEGSMAFLMREYKTLIIFLITMVIVLGLVVNPYTAGAFIVGAFSSALAGFLGMRAATNANVRTANATKENLAKGLKVAFSGGAVMGMSVVGLGLLGLTLCYILFFRIFNNINQAVEIVAGFSFGASSIALFARVGGGIYTKAADVGADLVGKVEASIPEDDPRNPAVIADNVGDNVGDTAGMGADLFESYIASLLSAMTIGVLLFGAKGITLPLGIYSIGIIAGIIGSFFVRSGKTVKEDFQEQTKRARSALNRGTLVTCILTAIGIYFLVKYTLGEIGIFLSVLSGLIAGLLIGKITEYFTSDEQKPVQSIAKAAEDGPARNILIGLSSGMKSAVLSIVVVCVAIYLAYYFANLSGAGLYGVPMAAVGLLATLSIVLSIDGYGPITDNAAGIAEMARMGEETRKRAESLDSVGNTTAAVNKGFAIASAVFTALALFSAYSKVTELKGINLSNINVLVGMLIGGMLAFIFCAITMKAVGKAAFQMVNEVRRQFKEIKGLMEGKAKPDYKKCVDISTKAALKEMIIPSSLAVIVPIALGLGLGAESVGGLLTGAIIVGSLLAITMANSGGAWDNAKKYIEAGNLGGKGSEPHKAAVIGDTVGDPFKDTSGPALNILIKVMSIVALIFAAIFI
jgi:K(+)-stimulated pyrophosphate-energized sodium pump